jgi:hypothetical protein
MRSSLVVRASDCQCTVLGSMPASVGTVESEGRQMKQCWILYEQKKKKIPKIIIKKYWLCTLVHNQAQQPSKESIPPAFVTRARSCKPFKEPRNRFPSWRSGTTTYLSARPARQHRLAESISRNGFLGSINVYKYGLWDGPVYDK